MTIISDVQLERGGVTFEDHVTWNKSVTYDLSRLKININSSKPVGHICRHAGVKMSSWTSSDSSISSNSSTKIAKHEVQLGKVLYSHRNAYSVLNFVGEGYFGKVALCKNVYTSETVAIKILKHEASIKQDLDRELLMLKKISALDPDNSNMVRFYEHFEHEGNICLVFELLDCNLIDMMEERQRQPLSLDEVRVIGHQLLVALDSLKALGIVHTDIKPDNIMLVNRKDQPLRVKLIDFGNAISASKVKRGLDIQPVGYRAPEITLGLTYSENIDVWSVGCILAFLLLPGNLFGVNCEYQMIKRIVGLLGQPDDHVLQTGKYTEQYFVEDEDVGYFHYRFMTPEEYEAANNMKPKEPNSCKLLAKPLEDLILPPLEGESAEGELEDRKAFMDLLTSMLHVDGNQRISAAEALQHPFITMTHLADPAGRSLLTPKDVLSEEEQISPPNPKGANGSNKSILKRIRKFFRRMTSSFYRRPMLMD
ncbi:homeodomain-interacting protein kinase 2-like [Nerophis lumbriciformis]|uniref:homeodomain-interacting protein kinase 2-like n=1 Tax=Nerophis lumbriciformis TaxID=546530 RepID=UPI003BA937DE